LFPYEGVGISKVFNILLGYRRSYRGFPGVRGNALVCGLGHNQRITLRPATASTTWCYYRWGLGWSWDTVDALDVCLRFSVYGCTCWNRRDVSLRNLLVDVLGHLRVREI
jgi:hypothetical protein